jgi:phosphate butyryltransferase
MIKEFSGLLAHAATLPEKKVLVILPANGETFEAIAQAQRHLNVRFILVGDREVIEHGVALNNIDLARAEIHHFPDPPDALEHGVEFAANGKADILMKGSIDTATMMKGVLGQESGLKTGKLLSDIFLLEYEPRTENKFIMITDGGMTLAPDLKNKVELIHNAVEVAHALGNMNPRVAVLSATEFVLPNLPSTLDAAALAKMSDRGQITGCIVDGPFALDNALSLEAAKEKHINSPVAGRAEILVAANIESANSLAKGTAYFGNVRLAHVIVGARVPILIPSRADKSDAKLLSVALGVIMAGYVAEHRDD